MTPPPIRACAPLGYDALLRRALDVARPSGALPVGPGGGVLMERTGGCETIGPPPADESATRRADFWAGAGAHA